MHKWYLFFEIQLSWFICKAELVIILWERKNFLLSDMSEACTDYFFYMFGSQLDDGYL